MTIAGTTDDIAATEQLTRPQDYGSGSRVRKHEYYRPSHELCAATEEPACGLNISDRTQGVCLKLIRPNISQKSVDNDQKHM